MRRRGGRRLQMFTEAIEEAKAAAEARATERIRYASDVLRSYKRSGVEMVPVDEVLRLLGESAATAPVRPASVQDEARARQLIASGADPLTGCMPVAPQTQLKPAAPRTAGFVADGPGGTGLDRIQTAVRRSRGGEAPPQIQGFG